MDFLDLVSKNIDLDFCLNKKTRGIRLFLGSKNGGDVFGHVKMRDIVWFDQQKWWIVATLSRDWTILDHIGPYWTILDHIGP